MNRRSSIFTSLAAIASATTVRPAVAAEEPKTATPQLEPIRAVLKAHDDAMTNHDLKGVLATLTPKAVIIGSGPGEIWSGPEEIEVAYTNFFSDFDKGHQEFVYHVRFGELTADMGWLMSSGEVKGKKGGKEFSFPMNISLTVTKAGGSWKIAALHFSTLTAEPAAK